MKITNLIKNKRDEEKCMIICLECKIGFIQYKSDKITNCKECGKLKDLEDRHIMRVGSFYGNSGLNQRNEVKRKTRCQWSENPG